MKRGNGSSGFTLLEVVVALAILGVSVAIVMQIFSGGLKNLRRIDLAHRAMSHGENVMSGDSGRSGNHWRRCDVGRTG